MPSRRRPTVDGAWIARRLRRRQARRGRAPRQPLGRAPRETWARWRRRGVDEAIVTPRTPTTSTRSSGPSIAGRRPSWDHRLDDPNQAPAIRPVPRPPRAPPEPTHPCIRCGRAGVPADAGLCERCNPLELPSRRRPDARDRRGSCFIVCSPCSPASSSPGPGRSRVRSSAWPAATGGLSVTLSVANEGSNASATTCTIREATPPRGDRGVRSAPQIAAGERINVTTVVTRFGPDPIALVASCGAQ